ncbi:WD-40 repeat family protein / notchless protein, putative isoform 1 [Hibiscus syriacus]|uniref:WD-40 repeat family protein / notchless protein, putative isoform 1 n=1 Tax=Hibiscus syriacus TaxID=106335 RepID=A0A6A2X8Y4_HIBSY|nr:WD-40 repeat family protein / notchless protein, putative isoform 1 [Hibiscus syriacus]
MNAAEKVVCVTGASGYIASWLVKLLLHRGYTVRTTVRDPNDPKKTQHLLSLDGAKERLHLFKAELLDEGCFDSVVEGCQGVFHLATPVIVSATDPQLWYMLSKTLAEEAAWRFAKDNRIDLVVLNPGFVIGPPLQPVLNITSVGSLPHERLVDVRDVAYAHIQAFEIPSANGRYCLVERNVQVLKILKTLNEFYPTLGLQEKCRDQDKSVEYFFRISQEKEKSLGLSFIPWDVSTRETIESLKERGFLIEPGADLHRARGILGTPHLGLDLHGAQSIPSNPSTSATPNPSVTPNPSATPQKCYPWDSCNP